MTAPSSRTATIIVNSADGGGGDGGNISSVGNAADREDLVGPDASPEKLRQRGMFQLQNGTWIDVGNARFWAPEALFIPALVGRAQQG
jgi:hypothetical protein